MTQRPQILIVDDEPQIRRFLEPSLVASGYDVLSAQAEKISALDLGADDYINKPFDIGELLARIRSAFRRRPGTLPNVGAKFSMGPVSIDVAQRRVTRNGEIIHLTPKEFDLFVLLARHAGRVMTHRQILTEVWGHAHAVDTQYLRVFIRQLRQKLEDNPGDSKLLLTEPGVGYRVADLE